MFAQTDAFWNSLTQGQQLFAILWIITMTWTSTWVSTIADACKSHHDKDETDGS